MERLAEAYIELAALPAPQRTAQVNAMPFPAQLRRALKNLDQARPCHLFQVGWDMCEGHFAVPW